MTLITHFARLQRHGATELCVNKTVEKEIVFTHFARLTRDIVTNTTHSKVRVGGQLHDSVHTFRTFDEE
jgi:hypothetical protein